MKNRTPVILSCLVLFLLILVATLVLWPKAPARKNGGSAESSSSSPHSAVTLHQQRLCKPVTKAGNVCTTANLLPYFPNETIAAQASSICNLESQGDPSTTSFVDFCRDGNPYSFGLFQINVIAKANLIPECAGVFTVKMNAANDDIACIRNKNGTCIVHDCRVADTAKFNACRAYVTDPGTNIALAAEIWKQNQSWTDWGSYAFCRAKF